MLYPWELTVEEWIGPRGLANSRKTPPPRLPAPPAPPARPAGPTEPFEGMHVAWAPTPETFFLLLDGETVVGQIGWNKATLLNKYRKRGLVRRLLVEYWCRYGKPELLYLWQATHGALTGAGRLLNVTTHASCVERRVAAGFDVPERVRASVTRRIGVRRDLAVSRELYQRLAAAVAEDTTGHGEVLLRWYAEHVRVEG